MSSSASTATQVTIRPRRIRRVCWVLAPVVVIFFVALGLLLTGNVGPRAGVFTTTDQFAMGALGLIGAATILLFTRPRVTADAERIVIRNVIGGYDLPWGVVRAVRFNRGSPWAALELEDDDMVAVMALQAVDKEYAVDGIRAIRALHAAYLSSHAGPHTPAS